MAIARKAVRSIVVLYPQGRFYGGEETDAVEAAIMNEAKNGNTRLILNMQATMFISSAFMGLLVKARADYMRRQGEIKLCGLVDTVERALHIPVLLSKFDYHKTEEEAIAAFLEPAAE
jgi:anti-anti-sigma factor